MAEVDAYVMEFDPVDRILRVTFHGELTDGDMREAFQRVLAFVQSEGGCGAIADFSDAGFTSVSSQAIRHLASLPPLVPDEFTRVVVGPQDVVFGMARMYQIAGGETRSRMHVVRTLAEAYEILGVSAPQFSRRIE